MFLNVSAVSYFICAGVFALAVALIVSGRAQHSFKRLLLVVSAITALWATAIASAALLQDAPSVLPLVIVILEHLRSAGWIVLTALALIASFGGRFGWKVVGGFITVTLSAMIYSSTLAALEFSGFTLPNLVLRGGYLAHVVVAIAALLLIENLFRNSTSDVRWSVKYLCFGLGVTFSYDFFLYAEAALLGHLDANIYAARGLIDAMAVPLVILASARSKSWPIDVHVSRKFVFHSATLLSAGTYLVALSAVGFGLRAFDSPWGAISQVLFLIAALLALVIVLASGQVQARAKTFISRNFFSYKYDYRVEWLRFIDAISDSHTNLSFPERVVQALANIIGSTSGNVWLRREEDGVFHAVGPWNMSDVTSDISVTEPWVRALEESLGVIDIKGRGLDAAKGFGAQLPNWLAHHPRALLVLPLVHGGKLIGLVVLGQMRAPRAFDLEDFDLLSTASRQAASYVAEESAAQALAQARRFESFNQRFAFIVHDVKNLTAQMTLILKNAERHGDNPEFQKDVLQTVKVSVARLRSMLEKLQGREQAAEIPVDIDLVQFLGEIAMTWKLQLPNLEANLPACPVRIFVHVEPLRAVVSHLIQNAADAAGQGVCVSLELHIEGVQQGADAVDENDGKWWAVITIADDGPGMEGKFVENNLFQPLRSTKMSGFGIGAFQARQIARDMGGRLEVESKCGHGTRMAVRLPYTPHLGIAEANAPEAQPSRLSKILRTA